MAFHQDESKAKTHKSYNNIIDRPSDEINIYIFYSSTEAIILLLSTGEGDGAVNCLRFVDSIDCTKVNTATHVLERY